MSRSINATLLAHYRQSVTSIATAINITRIDGTVFGFTSADKDVTFSSVLYKSDPGVMVSNIVTSLGMNVDNLEMTTLDDGTIFTKDDILAGKWRNAAFQLFRYNHVTPGTITEVFMVGNLGEIEMRRNTLVIELRGLMQYLKQPIGEVSTKTCRNRLGVSNGIDSFCTLNMTPFTFTGSITGGISGTQQFQDSTKSAIAAGRFNDGLLTWTSGNNQSTIARKIKDWSPNTFTLTFPEQRALQVGDTYSAVFGCQKRIIEDCKTIFNNVLNFRGEPYRPLVNDLTKPPRPSV